jgi:hypothetical protein
MWLQRDWGDGAPVAGRGAELFCAWLAWSRFRVVIPVWDRQMGTLTWCLDQALRVIGGAPAYLLTGSARTVTMDRIAGSWSGTRRWRAWAGITAPGWRPASLMIPSPRAGAEATVKIARADLVPADVNLLPAYESSGELQAACREFCDRVNGRVHRETGAVPADRLAAERELLHRLPDEPYALALGEERLAGDDQTIRYGSVRYSAPPGHARQPRIWVAGGSMIIMSRWPSSRTSG